MSNFFIFFYFWVVRKRDLLNGYPKNSVPTGDFLCVLGFEIIFLEITALTYFIFFILEYCGFLCNFEVVEIE